MELYGTLNDTGMMALIIFNFLHLKKYRDIPEKGRLRTWAANKRANGHTSFLFRDSLWCVASVMLICVFQYGPIFYLNGPFGKFVGTGANYFGFLYFAPFVTFAYCCIMRLDPLWQMDLVTPALPLALVFVKLACFSAGCCRGVPWEYGLINPFYGEREFPAQLLESACALLLFLFLMVMRNRMKAGTVFPIYLMLYSGIRFFTEFLRAEPAVLGPLKTYHILCLIGVALGAIEYCLVGLIRQRRCSRQNHAAPSQE